MRLEIGNINIKDIQLGKMTHVKDGVLMLDPDPLVVKVLEDERIRSARIELAKPGESVRITPVKDALEPRVKVSGRGTIFPGMAGNKVEQVGEGRTHVLKGVAVLTVGKIVGFQEGIVDMSGIGADYTPFSQTLNICLVMEPADGVESHSYEAAAREAGLIVTQMIGEAGREVEPDDLLIYEHQSIPQQAAAYPDLPKIGYVCMLQSQGLLHDTYVYGIDAKKIIPTLMSPTEFMDGAVVSGNCVASCDKIPTYLHQNDPLIEDLYSKHGEELNFMGVIITNENVFMADKERSSDGVAKLAAMIGLDGVIISEEGYGNPDTDLMMNCKKVEARGIKTVLVTDEFPGKDGKSESLTDAVKEADALVSCGQGNLVITLPPMERLIGTLEDIETMIGGYEGSLKEDGSIEAEIQIIISATSAIGGNKLAARMY
ncbi:MAG: glycine/sarcosine/betaine reductase component B subunit [Bacillota bacterium]|nr:glycine/sarcosine/betaine reductase component B subunit [Bacillota bacterium]MDW7677286.1 glycine/sarcosine/betaine reductase component B subunit [Bacillota bacterium]